MGSAPAMRIGETGLWWIPSLSGSLATVVAEGWLAGVVVLVVGTVVTGVVADTRRAEGFAEWLRELIGVAEERDQYVSNREERRGKREEEAIRLEQRLTDLEERLRPQGGSPEGES